MRVAVPLPEGGKGVVRSSVVGGELRAEVREDWVHLEVASLSDHEVLVIG